MSGLLRKGIGCLEPGRKPRGAAIRLFLTAIFVTALILCAKAWHDTMADPIVRTTDVKLSGLSPDAPQLRLLLVSDLHVAGPDMPPSRLLRIVRQANDLKPDIVLIAGDLISDRKLATRKYSYREALAPLEFLTPRLSVVAVLGNHEHWRDAELAREELARVGIIVLNNSAKMVGPLAIGGLDDDFTGHADMRRTVSALRQLTGTPIMLSHSPDPFPEMPRDIGLMLAGHTHCGQIQYPWGGSPATMSRFGERYSCGRIDENGQALVVTAGLGTSVLPFRFGAVPDMWLITLKPARVASHSR